MAESDEKVTTSKARAVDREKAAVAPKVKVVQEPRTLFTFDRYFSTLGRPAHHKAGMRAFLKGYNSKQKKTVEEWNRLFTNY